MAFAGLALLTRLKRSPTIQCTSSFTGQTCAASTNFAQEMWTVQHRGARYFLMEHFLKTDLTSMLFIGLVLKFKKS